jgi:hypothetical protein
MLLDDGIPEHANRLDFTFDPVAWETIARRGDNSFSWLPPTSKLAIGRPASNFSIRSLFIPPPFAASPPHSPA